MNTIDIANIAEECGIEGAPAKVTWSTLNRFAEAVAEFAVKEKMDNMREMIIASLLEESYELIPPHGAGKLNGTQIVNGKWYAPIYGCETLQKFLD